jgi:hypothetical protein
MTEIFAAFTGESLGQVVSLDEDTIAVCSCIYVYFLDTPFIYCIIAVKNRNPHNHKGSRQCQKGGYDSSYRNVVDEDSFGLRRKVQDFRIKNRVQRKQ